MKGFENMVIQKNDMVFYQTNNEKAWQDPLRYWMWIRIGYLLLEMETLRRCQNIMYESKQ